MNMMIAMKRTLFALLTLSGVALVALGAAPKVPCPLPITSSGTSASASASTNTQSPEKQPCMRLVNHNGMPICLPCPAATAHEAHGDADLGPCNKPGNQK